jgi:hypothetical protein
MPYQIKVLKQVLKKVGKYAGAEIGEGVSGDLATRVINEIIKVLDYLGLEHWVSMEEFLNAAARLGLDRKIGSHVYNALALL